MGIFRDETIPALAATQHEPVLDSAESSARTSS